jgi:N-acetyl sugar amidotransferase
MDSTDPELVLDREGVCNHCRRFERRTAPAWRALLDDPSRLEAELTRIRKEGEGRQYDCIIGLSGGIDSSYVALLTREYGLRPLAVHFDSGWNSELASANIEAIVRTLRIDLHTIVCDWPEMRSLQLAFFRASLANCDVPQDHAFVAALYKAASAFRIRTIISGHNTATESILPKAWGYTSRDLTHLQAVHQRFGDGTPLRNYPQMNFVQQFLYYPYVRRVRTLRVLDYRPYDKNEARGALVAKLGWREYGGKHHESRFTKFFQSYYLPKKFGFDKRRAHYSSLIAAGHMTRSEALELLAAPPFDLAAIEADKAYVAKKLGVSDREFDEIIALPPRTHRDYPYNRLIDAVRERRHG